MSTIYIIPTPIGNLGDITYRAIDVLKKSDKIFAEDTRISKKLLLHYGVKQKLYPYHQHNEHFVVDKIIENLLEDKQVISLVSDAGTPGISDPGYLLVTKAIERNNAVFCIPGPTALIPAIVQSGFPTNEFLFVGFLPQKKGRQKKLKEIAQQNFTQVLYESPHRLLKLIKEIALYYGEEKQISISKEITKIHENHFRGTAKEMHQIFSSTPIKGEFVVVIEKNKNN